MKLRSSYPYNESYSFLGWNTSPDAAGTWYQPGDNYSANGSVTLYAMWYKHNGQGAIEGPPKGLQVDFDTNGGIGGPIIGFDGSIISAIVPVREGYTFQGWVSSSYAETAEYQPGDKCASAGDGVHYPALYAVWKRNQDAVTRAEWIHDLVELFDMTVEQDNMPDNYFTDIDEQSPYYHDVMVAAEFGVIDLEAGYPFEPEEPATRDFAARTMNFCLGFQPDENSVYPFSDSADVARPDDALIAVERGWLALAGGRFMPGKNITAAEKGVMLSDAAIVRESTNINENHNNIYEFENWVVEIPAVTYAEVDGNGIVTIYNCPKTISIGQTFVVYFNDIPRAYTAQSVSVDASITTITTTAKEVNDILVAADAQGSIDVDLSSIEPAEGVVIAYENSSPQAIRALASGANANEIPL